MFSSFVRVFDGIEFGCFKHSLIVGWVEGGVARITFGGRGRDEFTVSSSTGSKVVGRSEGEMGDPVAFGFSSLKNR